MNDRENDHEIFFPKYTDNEVLELIFSDCNISPEMKEWVKERLKEILEDEDLRREVIETLQYFCGEDRECQAFFLWLILAGSYVDNKIQELIEECEKTDCYKE